MEYKQKRGEVYKALGTDIWLWKQMSLNVLDGRSQIKAHQIVIKAASLLVRQLKKI